MSASEAAGTEGSADSGALVEAERSGRPFLVYRDRGNTQRLFPLPPDTDSASVGRLPSCDLVLDWDAKVSRVHARLELLEGAWVVVDDGLSSNGTFVNDARVRGSHRLSDGDAVRFGKTTAVFRSPAPDKPPTSEAAAAPVTVQLSSTQRRVLEALCGPCKPGGRGASPATEEQIAEQLVLSLAEVRGHLRVLCAKLDVDQEPPAQARAELARRAFEMGLIAAHDH